MAAEGPTNLPSLSSVAVCDGNNTGLYKGTQYCVPTRVK